jgi:hypothetical protein
MGLIVSSPVPPFPPIPPAAPERYARPEDFLGVGDGFADDTAAVQSAVNDGRPVLLLGRYKVSSTIQVANPRLILNHGGELLTTANAPILRVTSESKLVGIRCLGDGQGAFEDQAKTSQHGIFVDGGRGTILDNCGSKLAGGDSIRVENTASVLWGVQVIAPWAEQCNNAIHVANSGEYVAVTNAQYHKCHRGAFIEAGNFNWTGGKVLEGRSSIWIAPGVNDAHGLITGVQCNHQTANTLRAVGPINNGFRIARCTFYGGAVVLVGDTKGIAIEDTTLSGVSFYLNGMGAAGRLILERIRWNATNTVFTAAPLGANVVSSGGTDLLTGLARADL